MCKLKLFIVFVIKAFELYNGEEIEDKKKLHCIGTSINVFFADGEDIYMRDIAFDYVKIGKWFIEYNKERDCAILNLKI